MANMAENSTKETFLRTFLNSDLFFSGMNVATVAAYRASSSTLRVLFLESSVAHIRQSLFK
jgi:hypothetical protein